MADTVDSQLVLLNDNLSHVNIGQSPYEMGNMAILILHNIATNKPFQETTYTPLNPTQPHSLIAPRKII
jgi:ribose transport system substrate-binding protein